MKKFKIKVCGITRPRDARLATQLGADMLGMIFYKKSPRYINTKKALAIVKVIPPTVDRVGVFVNETTEKMLKIACKLQLDFLQLSGNETNDVIVRLQKNGFKVIKSFHIKTRKDYKQLFESKADIVLLDNTAKNIPGGTGARFDWSIKPPRKISNLMLAGGINVDNVKGGVDRFQPLIIDVNSGVEDKPGMKSEKKLVKFFKKCNVIRYGC